MGPGEVSVKEVALGGRGCWEQAVVRVAFCPSGPQLGL